MAERVSTVLNSSARRAPLPPRHRLAEDTADAEADADLDTADADVEVDVDAEADTTAAADTRTPKSSARASTSMSSTAIVDAIRRLKLPTAVPLKDAVARAGLLNSPSPLAVRPAQILAALALYGVTSLDDRVPNELLQRRKSVAVSPDMTVRAFSAASGVSMARIFAVLRDLITSRPTPDSPMSRDVIDVLSDELGLSPSYAGSASPQSTTGTSSASTDGSAETEDALPQPLPADRSALPPRAPVVTIMGHVDHGKTTLLDALRNTRVADSEAGGITQHLAAFRVRLPTSASQDATVTFLDTPGHAAFSGIRQRGAQVTDLVVLVVAADDGVMEQTVESIKFARAAGVPIVVAITKIDKPNADVRRVKQALLREQVILEEFGGDVLSVSVCAPQRQGIAELVELLALSAELAELRAPTDGLAEGTLVEARASTFAGTSGTVIVQRGTLRTGDTVVCGTAWTRVKIMRNDVGKDIRAAGPSDPVEIVGWQGEPTVGGSVLQVDGERRAKQVVAFRAAQQARQLGAAAPETSAVVVAAAPAAGKNGSRRFGAAAGHGREMELLKSTAVETPTISVVLKCDAHGTVEALTECLQQLSCDKVCDGDHVVACPDRPYV
jgi:small GTP-binding protein